MPALCSVGNFCFFIIAIRDIKGGDQVEGECAVTVWSLDIISQLWGIVGGCLEAVTPFSQHESSDKIEKEKAAETSEYWKLWVPGVWTSVSFWHELVFFSIFLFSGCLRLWMLRCILLDGLSLCHLLICFYPLTPSFLRASECTSALSYSASAACLSQWRK